MGTFLRVGWESSDGWDDLDDGCPAIWGNEITQQEYFAGIAELTRLPHCKIRLLFMFICATTIHGHSVNGRVVRELAEVEMAARICKRIFHQNLRGEIRSGYGVLNAMYVPEHLPSLFSGHLVLYGSPRETGQFDKSAAQNDEIMSR